MWPMFAFGWTTIETQCRPAIRPWRRLREIEMANQDVLQRVINVTARVLGLEPATIRKDSNFVFDLGAESVQSVELVAAFEEEFGIEMEEDAALAVQTVGDAADFIARHLKV
jgi:acyl carrier protein